MPSPSVLPRRDPRPSPSAVLAREEDTLAERIRAGDVDAFGAFFRLRYGELHAFACRHLGEAAMAEDIVQDVFLGIWRNRATFGLRGTGSARGYLYQAVRNRIAHRRSRDRVEWTWGLETEQSAEGLAEPADHRVRQRDTAEAIRQAVTTLPPRCREVFILSRAQGLSNTEIADALGVSRKTVEQHLWRAVGVLRQRLAPYMPVLIASVHAGLGLLRLVKG